MPVNETLGTWRQAVATWFWTNTGAILLVIIALIMPADSNNRGGLPSDIIEVIGSVAVIGALLSLPVVPVAYCVLRYVLALPGRVLRLGSALLAVTVFMGLATLLLRFMASFAWKGIMDYAGIVVLVYLPASLVAHAVVYRHELFRSGTGE